MEKKDLDIPDAVGVLARQAIIINMFDRGQLDPRETIAMYRRAEQMDQVLKARTSSDPADSLVTLWCKLPTNSG